MYTLALFGAALVPFTCIKLWLLKVELFKFRTLSRSQVRLLAEGWFCPAFVSYSSTISSPSSVSMFVYWLDTSNVTNMLSLGTLSILVGRLMNSVVFFMYDGYDTVNKNSSTYIY